MIKKCNQVLGFVGWVGGGMEKSNYYIDTLHPTNARGNIFYTVTEFFPHYNGICQENCDSQKPASNYYIDRGQGGHGITTKILKNRGGRNNARYIRTKKLTDALNPTSNYNIDTLHPTNAQGNIFYTMTEFFLHHDGICQEHCDGQKPTSNYYID